MKMQLQTSFLPHCGRLNEVLCVYESPKQWQANVIYSANLAFDL